MNKKDYVNLYPYEDILARQINSGIIGFYDILMGNCKYNVVMLYGQGILHQDPDSWNPTDQSTEIDMKKGMERWMIWAEDQADL